MKKILFASAILCLALASCDKDPAKPSGFETPKDAVNLSENGTANSYIVKPGSTVALNAKFKGNSTTELTGEVAGVKLVWQSEKDLVKSLNFASKTFEIVAETNEISGNTLIAALESEDNILWVGH